MNRRSQLAGRWSLRAFLRECLLCAAGVALALGILEVLRRVLS
ncbi:MAG TPA: hypothetical protein VNL38_04265 [Candidatus Nitrosotenuis sp.]|nr:hypothetical protein [Candidatus Nitrosotenuis sp.]